MCTITLTVEWQQKPFMNVLKSELFLLNKTPSELASGHQEIFERFQMISRYVKMKSSDSVALYNGLILYQTPIISQNMSR